MENLTTEEQKDAIIKDCFYPLLAILAGFIIFSAIWASQWHGQP